VIIYLQFLNLVLSIAKKIYATMLYPMKYRHEHGTQMQHNTDTETLQILKM